MNTIEYLMKNELTILHGLGLTLIDYDYVKESGFKGIVINCNKPTHEELKLQDIIQRIRELFYLYKNTGSDVDFRENEILKIIKE